ncbi:MAG: hypothetical protein QXU95_03355, partial [Candidatus Bathyarchaeia archaeon]
LHIHNGSIKNSAAGGGGGVYQGYANGVMYMSIRPGEDTMIQLPTDAYVEAYFFAKETAQLTIDDIPVTVQSDSPYLFTQPGLHKVRSNKEIILQINLWPREPEIQGLWFKGTPIPCIETASIKPDVTIHSLEETGFPMTQIIIGVAIVAVIGAVVIILRRRSATKVAASP